MAVDPQTFEVSKDSYVNFDGDSIRNAVKTRLTEAGLFTDQNYEGSNLAHWNEIISYIFSMLMFSLNKQSSEGMYTEAQLYENINKIVKAVDYKPIGHQTPVLSFEAYAEGLSKGLYSFSRYSYIDIGGVRYSFSNDVTISKTVDSTKERLSDFDSSTLLYQGTFIEYPNVNARGNSNEIIYLTTGESVNIDHFNVDVYVLDAVTQKWTEWDQTSSLYLNKANDPSYEIRYNENRIYEIKFGNGINGKKLNAGDKVAIYYLQTSGKAGEVGAKTLEGKSLTFFRSNKLNSILADVVPHREFYNFNPATALTFTNPAPSSYYSEPESIESIRENAPGIYRSQYRVVTQSDYITYIKTNFFNLVSDVSCFNNNEFLDRYLSYFSNLGLLDSNQESRALFNQITFSDSCNFNNVYLFVVPKTIQNTIGYLNPSQKQLILDSIRSEQIITSETILLDPVYLEFDIILGDNNNVSVSDRDLTDLVIERVRNSKIPEDIIKQEVVKEIENFFSRDKNRLGTTINLNELAINILSVPGVNKIYTRRNDLNSVVEGLRFSCWVPAYGDTSIQNIVTNKTLEDFEFPYLSLSANLSNRIKIQNSGYDLESVDN